MTSSTLTAKLGSVETLKLLTRCGLKLCSAQMRCTLVWLMPISLAMVRTLQCVALAGRSFTVFSTTLSLIPALMGFLPGGLERLSIESCDTGFGEILLPAPNRGLGDATHDRHHAMTIRCHEDDPCAFDDLLGCISIGNQPLQLEASLPLEHESQFIVFHSRSNHYHTKDSNVYDTTLAYARSICGCRSRSCWGFGTAGVMIHAPRHEGERQRICGSDVVLRRRAVTWFLPGVAPKTLPATRRLHHPMKPRSPGGQKSVAVPNRVGDCSCDAGEAGISRPPDIAVSHDRDGVPPPLAPRYAIERGGEVTGAHVPTNHNRLIVHVLWSPILGLDPNPLLEHRKCKVISGGSAGCRG